jgi:glycosyltransferase involved in cell wall biosynthesis
MRILLTGFQFTTVGGLEIVSSTLARILATLGHDVQCAAIHGDETSDGGGYRIVGTAPANRLARSVVHRVPALYPLRRLRRMVDWSDLIIAVHCHTLPWVYAAIGSRRAPPIAAWLHGLEVWGGQGRRYAGWLRRADRLVAVSHYTAGSVASLLGESHRPTVIHNPVDTDFFKASEPAEDVNRHTILTVGRLAPGTEHKGYGTLIKAIALLERREPAIAVRLRIAGGGSRLAALRELAAATGVAPSVEFLGSVSKSELRRLYATSDLFAFPSSVVEIGQEVLGEGFGVVNIEAAACGRPVLTSTRGGCPETIREGVTGVLVDPTRVEAVADGIAALLRQPASVRDEMGRKGREFVEANFSYPVFAARVGSWVEALAARRPA